MGLGDLASNTLNGYIGGHGVRLILKVSADQTDATLEEIFNHDPKLAQKIFNITVFNFNPEKIGTKNSFGFVAPQNMFSGLSISNKKQFKRSENLIQKELKGTIFPDGYFGLDNAILNLITADDPVQDLKDLEFLGSIGVYFTVTEIKSATTVDNMGRWYLLKLDYDKSKFIYASNAKKIDFTMTLEKEAEDDLSKDDSSISDKLSEI